MQYAIGVTPMKAIAPLFVLVAAFVAFGLGPYLTLDPTRSRVPPPADFPAYYSLLVAHVAFGSVAMLTCGFQVWPWFRDRFPTAHRRIGYLYIFGGVLPAGCLGLIIATVSPFGPVVAVSSTLLAIVWLSVTMTGFRNARRQRFVEHRRWMIRSFALTMSVISNRLWAVIWFIVLSPQLPTTFAGNEALMVQTIAGLSGWLGWVLPLIAAECWLESERNQGLQRTLITTNS